MRHKHRRLITVFCSLPALVAAGAAPAGDGSDTRASLRVQVVDLRNERGQIRVGVFESAKGFPKRRDAAVLWKSISADAAEPAVNLSLHLGRYAIVVLHDEDSDRALDTNFIGVPTEGYGVTNNPKPRLRAATFNEAAFTLGAEGAEKTVSIQYF